MSGIYIPNMEMPKACFWKESKDGCTHTCFLAGTCQASSYTLGKYGVKPDSCPLKEVPTHGELISRQDVIEVLKDACEEGCNDIYTNGVRRAIFDEVLEVVEDKEILPTVLEANNGNNS